jgi:hypothetical protein
MRVFVEWEDATMSTEPSVTTTIRQTVVVGPGGVVVVRQPWLTPGAEVQVEILVPGPLSASSDMSNEELSIGLAQALQAAEIDSPEKIVALIQEVKREQFQDRFTTTTSSSNVNDSTSAKE